MGLGIQPGELHPELAYVQEKAWALLILWAVEWAGQGGQATDSSHSRKAVRLFLLQNSIVLGLRLPTEPTAHALPWWLNRIGLAVWVDL